MPKKRATMQNSREGKTPFEALIHEVFRFNGALLAVGDGVFAQLGLTSARMQVLAAIGFLKEPRSVAGLANYLGLRRQGVQRIVNEIVEEGIASFQDNPQHRRAKLVLLTSRGRKIYQSARGIEKAWLGSICKGLPAENLLAARDVLQTLLTQLEKQRSGKL